MKTGRNAILPLICEAQAIRILTLHFRPQRQHAGLMRDLYLGPQQGHDHPLDPRQIAQKINFQHGLNFGGHGHGGGGLLCKIRLGKWRQSDHKPRFRFAQDACDLIRLKQGVYGHHNARNHPRQKGQDSFGAIGQHKGHHILWANAKPCKQIGQLGHLRPEALPIQCLCFCVRI